jgi:hypothetical protein
VTEGFDVEELLRSSRPVADAVQPLDITCWRAADRFVGEPQVRRWLVDGVLRCRYSNGSNRRAGMASSWTPECRTRQAALTRTWKPCQQAAGQRTPDGATIASSNVHKDGHCLRLPELSRLINAKIKTARTLAT